MSGKYPGGLIGMGLGLLAVGAAVGVTTERAMMRRAHRGDSEADEPLGSLRGEPIDLVGAGGVKLHVEVNEATRADAGDLTLIFTHGYALNQDCWHYQRRDLRSIGRLVFWDQRSHGRSERSAADANTLPQLGEDLATVIKATAGDGPVVLIGHSMGGMTLMEYAAAHPEEFGTRIRGAALLGTTSGGMTEVPLGLPKTAAAPLHKVLPVAAQFLASNKGLVEAGRSRVNDLSWLLTRTYSFGSNPSARITDFTHEMLSATPIDVISEFLITIQAHDRADSLHPFTKVETLVMSGAADVMTPPEHSERIVAAVPGAELVILPDTGHMLMLERYPEVNQGIRDLVARVRRNLAQEKASPSGS